MLNLTSERRVSETFPAGNSPGEERHFQNLREIPDLSFRGVTDFNAEGGNLGTDFVRALEVLVPAGLEALGQKLFNLLGVDVEILTASGAQLLEKGFRILAKESRDAGDAAKPLSVGIKNFPCSFGGSECLVIEQAVYDAGHGKNVSQGLGCIQIVVKGADESLFQAVPFLSEVFRKRGFFHLARVSAFSASRML